MNSCRKIRISSLSELIKLTHGSQRTPGVGGVISYFEIGFRKLGIIPRRARARELKMEYVEFPNQQRRVVCIFQIFLFHFLRLSIPWRTHILRKLKIVSSVSSQVLVAFFQLLSLHSSGSKEENSFFPLLNFPFALLSHLSYGSFIFGKGKAVKHKLSQCD